MRFKIIELDFITDRLRGIRKGMRGYVTTIVCNYLGHNLYAVTLENGTDTMLYDWQIENI